MCSSVLEMLKQVESLLNKHPQVFLLCCDLRNFSAVARALHISQSAVSKAIFELEEDLGFTLFDRSCRPMKPTPEALVLRRHISRVLNDTKKLLTQIRQDNLIKPTLRIGITEALSTTLGMSIVRQMLPEVSSLDIIVVSSGFLYQRLLERKLDIIITNDAHVPTERISRKELFEEPSVLILPKSMERPASHKWTWEELNCCGLPLIRFGSENGAGQVNEAFLRSQGLKVPERIIAHNNTMLLSLIAEGIGWVYARPTTVLQNEHLLDRLHLAPFPDPQLTRKVYMFYRDDEYGPQMEQVLKFAKAELRDNIFPQILRFAPWVESQMRIAEDDEE